MHQPQGFSDEVELMLNEAGFEPCFVRNLVEGNLIQIQRLPGDEKPTEMVVTDLFLSGTARRMNIGEAQWIGKLTDGRKIHCTYDVKIPVWRQPGIEAAAPQPVWFGQED